MKKMFMSKVLSLVATFSLVVSLMGVVSVLNTKVVFAESNEGDREVGICHKHGDGHWEFKRIHESEWGGGWKNDDNNKDDESYGDDNDGKNDNQRNHECNKKHGYNDGEEETTPTGSIEVCKIVTDSKGNVVAGNEGNSFTVPFINATYEGPATAVPSSVTFTTPLTLSTVFGDVSGQCETINKLAFGRYYYGEESVDSSKWETPLYNDGANGTVTSLGDLKLFNSGLDTANDNNDGVINISESNPSRTLIVLNKMKEVPQQCNIVSDTTNIVENGVYAVPTSTHSSWISDAILNPAKWIWDKYYVTTPLTGETKVFLKNFTVTGTVQSAVIKLASDNGYKLEINGNLVDDKTTVENNFTSSVAPISLDVKSYLKEGNNSIKFTVINFPLTDGTVETNPAGLLYNLEISVLGNCNPVLDIPTCGDNQTFDSNTNSCINVPIVCTTGQELVEGHCVTPTLECKEGQKLVDGKCVTPTPETPKHKILSGSMSGGQVLGAETSCGIYVDKFLKKGLKGNDGDAVKKIQSFLNDYMTSGLSVDGKFGTKTDEALKSFQQKHSDKILTPWRLTKPTGIFYLTTQTEVNNIICPTLGLPIPALTPMDQNPLFPKA